MNDDRQDMPPTRQADVPQQRKTWTTPAIITSAMGDTMANNSIAADGSDRGIAYGLS